MAHYALIDSETMLVTQVFVGRDEDDLAPGVDDWETYYAVEGTIVRRTSYNTKGNIHRFGGTPFRYNYAGVGFTFDAERGEHGAFIPPQPYPSWILNEFSCTWEAPIPRPEGQGYVWDESAGEWVVVE